MESKTTNNSKKFKLSAFLIILAALLLVPVLYSSVYLTSIWDVYNKLDNVPVAFVNLDKPVVKDGKEYSAGKEIEKNLKDNKKFKWCFVSQNEAMNGINNSKYYAVIEVPEDFSQKISDAAKGKFENPQIIYIGNRGKNYVFSMISSRAADSLKFEVSSTIQKEASKVLIDSLKEVKVSLKDAGNGAGKLQNGTQKLLAGSNKLSSGLNTATSGSKQLAAGLKTLTTGEAQVVDGTSKLVDGLKAYKDGSTKANGQVSQLVKGASDLNNATGLISQGAAQLDASTGLMANAVNAADAYLNNPNLSDSQKVAAAKQYLDALSKQPAGPNGETKLALAVGATHQLAGSLDQLKTGSQKVSDGVGALAAGLDKAAAGQDQLINGAEKLQTGSSAILAGMNTVTDKTMSLSEGLSALSSGSSSLTTGLKTADDGAITLATGLNDGYKKLDDNLKYSSEDMSQFISKPVTVKDESINDVKCYGVGLAPYFISMSLWLGAMFVSILFMVGKFVNIFNRKSMQTYIGKYAIGCILVALQAITLSFTIVSGLGVTPVNIPAFYLINILMSITFFSVMYGSSNGLGAVSAAFMFLMLVLQIAASGGTFPIESAPAFYRTISNYLPMTYGINALRLTISGINQTVLNHDISVMLIFIGVSLLGGLILGKIFKHEERGKQVMETAKSAFTEA